MDPLDRIIWSADLADVNEVAGALLNMTGPHVPHALRIIKLDRLFLTEQPLSVIEQISDWDVKVFVDAKIIEIPSKVEALARKYVKHRPWMLNCMAGCLSNGVTHDPGEAELDGLARFASVCLEAEVKPCAVTVLTSKSHPIVMDEFKRTPEVQVLFYVEKLIEAGFTDVVCSPQEAHSIKQMFGDAITINCPGIRLADAGADDQARKSTPAGAVAAGADRLVIGRPITNGQLPRILEELAAPLHGKGPS